MNHEILKYKTVFRMGISNVVDLQNWLNSHTETPGLVFAGRSNVGKSTLLNSLFGKIARTSKTPGRTQQVNIFECWIKYGEDDEQMFYLFDIPGYGHANVSKAMQRNWQALLSSLFDSLGPKQLVISLQDARHPAQKADFQFYKFIQNYDIDIFLVLNKFDKLKNQKERNAFKKKMPELFVEFKKAKQIYTVSAEKGKGLLELETGLVNFIHLHHEISS